MIRVRHPWSLSDQRVFKLQCQGTFAFMKIFLNNHLKTNFHSAAPPGLPTRSEPWPYFAHLSHNTYICTHIRTSYWSVKREKYLEKSSAIDLAAWDWKGFRKLPLGLFKICICDLQWSRFNIYCIHFLILSNFCNWEIEQSLLLIWRLWKLVAF